MVHADADCRMVFLTYTDKRYEFLFNLLQFSGVLLVGVLQVLEGAARVNVVSRIDAHLLAVLGCHVGGMSREVDVGH